MYQYITQYTEGILCYLHRKYIDRDVGQQNVWSGGIGNGRVCTKLHNDKIYSLNDIALIILYSTDIAYRLFKVLIYN